MEIIKLLTALKVEQLIIYVYCESPVFHRILSF